MISPRWLVQSSAAGAVIGALFVVSMSAPGVPSNEAGEFGWIVEGPMCPVEVWMEEPEAKKMARPVVEDDGEEWW